MTAPADLSAPRAVTGGQTRQPIMLNHAAYVTHDIEATARFFTEILGMPIASCVMDDVVPSTGDKCPFIHLFFRLADGSTIAYFEAPILPPANAKGHPLYDTFDHIAFEVEDVAAVDSWREHLIANGVDVVGPITHDGLIYSIYFRDPNGHRLELTTPLNQDWNHDDERASAELAMWVKAKRQAIADGTDIVHAAQGVVNEFRVQRSTVAE
jgi:catechol 2,3-dioxygenase-like lactoylglutathione lyase family enzyme